MNLIVIDDTKEIRKYPIKNIKKNLSLGGNLIKIPSSPKEKSALKILDAYFSNAKLILYDSQNSVVEKLLKELDLSNFEKKDFSTMLFTSGSTGVPTGVLKSKENIEEDVRAIVEFFSKFNAQAVVSTVPFIHVYGFLVALLMPIRLGIDIIFKEHFLPHDLLKFATSGRIIVTTPIYIKSLLQLNVDVKLKDTVFVCSAGPLLVETAKAFIDKFDTTLVQIFGSTETGSIAFRIQDENYWTPFKGVKLKLSKEGMLQIKSPFIANELWSGNFSFTNNELQTFDYAELKGSKFKLIGRSQEIFKLAGKRVCVTNIEEQLERKPQIQKALIYIKRDEKALKDESLKLFVELSAPLDKKKIIGYVKEFLKSNAVAIDVAVVEKIPTSATGKKMLPILE